MKLASDGTYQGYKIVAVRHQRSKGLAPDVGNYVLIDYADCKKLELVGREVPWRGANGYEFDSMLSILAWSEGIPGVSATVPAAIPAPGDGGFNLFGDLLLKTAAENGGGAIGPTVVYKDIYVDPTGIEELTRGHLKAPEHSQGLVKVMLTDVRINYATNGPAIFRINCKLKSGEWDTDTLKDGTTKPWSAKEAIEFLFAMLPGSPLVRGWSELSGLSLDPPSDLVGEGEPAVEHLQKLLDFYGLDAQLQPDNNYAVSKKLSKKVTVGNAPVGGGAVTAAGHPTGIQIKSPHWSRRSPCFVAIGKRRIRQMTLHYVPVLQDVDGRWYRMSELVDKWGYSMEQVNRQILNDYAKKFKDCPPQPGSGSGKLHSRRVEILKKAYHCYAPGILFASGKGGSGGKLGFTFQGFGGGPAVTLNVATAGGISDPDFQKLFCLPMKECPIYVAQLQQEGIGVSGDQFGGDSGAYALTAPIARAARISQGFFKDFDAVEEYYAGMKDAVDEEISSLTAVLQEYQEQIAAAGEDLQRVATFLPNMTKASQSKYLAWTGQDGEIVQIDADVELALLEVGVVKSSILKKRMDTKAWGTISKIKRLVSAKAQVQANIESCQGRENQWTDAFETLKLVNKNKGGLQLRMNIPHNPLEDGVATFDKDTGILTSSEPLCVMGRPFIPEGEGARVIADGSVTVTFGYELKQNVAGDFTTLLFLPKKNGETEELKCVGASTAGPIKGQPIPFSGRLYEGALGTPMNLNQVLAEARQKIGESWRTPRTTDGYIAEYHGLQGWNLDGGVERIVHEWDGSSTGGTTTIAINVPDSPTLGPRPRKPRTDGADGRQDAERESP